MGLLSEIQNDAVSTDASVTALLRKCLVLAARLDSDLLEDWVKHELNGYPQSVDVPDYRILDLQFKGSFVGPAGAQLKNAPVPPHIVETIVGDDRFSRFHARQAITTIDNSRKVREAGVLMLNFDNLGMLVGGKVYRGYQCLSFWGETPAMGVVGIIEAVKTRVLDFALVLAKKYPIAGEIGGLSMRDEDSKKEFQTIFQNSIYGNVGFLGNASGSTINVAIGAGNFEQLSSALRNNGVLDSDIESLEVAVGQDPQVLEEKKFGPKVTAWLGNMMTKAASGGWDIGLAAAGSLLQAALLGYYGYK